MMGIVCFYLIWVLGGFVIWLFLVRHTLLRVRILFYRGMAGALSIVLLQVADVYASMGLPARAAG